jgi:hypothetical protein
MKTKVLRAITQLSFNCGCGFKTTSTEEAENHAVETGHQLSVLGTVEREQK